MKNITDIVNSYRDIRDKMISAIESLQDLVHSKGYVITNKNYIFSTSNVILINTCHSALCARIFTNINDAHSTLKRLQTHDGSLLHIINANEYFLLVINQHKELLSDINRFINAYDEQETKKKS